MKDCKKIHPMLSDYLDGSLKPAEAGQVEAHLKACAEARKKLEGLKRLREVLAALPEPKMPQDLHDKIMARLQGRPVPLRPHRPFWILPAGAMAVAASITLILLVQNPDMLSLRGKNKAAPASSPAAPNRGTASAGARSLAGNTAGQVQTLGGTLEESKGNELGNEQNRTTATQPSQKRAVKKVVAREMIVANSPAEESAAPALKAGLPSGPSAVTSFQGATTEKQETEDMAQTQEKAKSQAMNFAPQMQVAEAPRAAAPLAAAPAAAPVPTPITSWGGSLNPSTPELQQLVTDADSFQKYWQTLQPGQPLPNVDFTQQAVIVLMDQERPSGGYSIHVSNLEDKLDQLVIHYQVQAPAPGAVTAQVLTRPWALQVIPKPSKPVVFQKDP